MRSIFFFLLLSVLFSCESEKVVEVVPDYERELIGFGMAGPHPDSLVGTWEFNPFPFDAWHARYLPDVRYKRVFSADTMMAFNCNLGYSVIKLDENYTWDTSKSKYLVSRELDLFRFDKIEGRKEMPDRFYVKKYPNTLPVGFRYFCLDDFDLSYKMEFIANSEDRMELIVQQRDNVVSSKVNRFCLRRSWTPDEQMYINTFLQAFCENRLDTLCSRVTSCDGSTSATLVFNDSVYHYSWPVFNYRYNYLKSFFVSRLKWYHYTEERLPMPYLKREYFHGLPVVIEMEGPPNFD
jgi:hypothetical protein